MAADCVIALSSSQSRGPPMWNFEGEESRVNYKTKVAVCLALDREDLIQTLTKSDENANKEKRQQGASGNLSYLYSRRFLHPSALHRS